MADEPGRPDDGPPPHVSAEDARGGEIILRTRRRRIVFVAGLVGIVILFALLRFAGVA